MRRILVLLSRTSYRGEAFVDAAARRGIELVVGIDRCRALDQQWEAEAHPGLLKGSLALDFRRPQRALATIRRAARGRPFAAVVPTDDATAVLAAEAAALLGLPGSSPEAAYTARNKLRLRRALAGAGVPQPRFAAMALDQDPATAPRPGPPPWVVKPLLLAGSRGVIRADDEAALGEAVARVRHLLDRPELARFDDDPARRQLLIEQFVPGPEVAVEGILRRGRLRLLALFDKPDPLDGPFFEETIYVTPSRLPEAEQRRIVATTEAAAQAIGLGEGPVHGELRLAAAGPTVIEVAARSIGGLCARTLRFGLGGDGGAHSLEEIVLAHAVGEELAEAPLPGAAGVMMIPIPRGGVLLEVGGIDGATAVAGMEEVVITARLGDRLVPLPEGASYLGFLFARGARPDEVEAALRAAHGCLRFTIAATLL